MNVIDFFGDRNLDPTGEVKDTYKAGDWRPLRFQQLRIKEQVRLKVKLDKTKGDQSYDNDQQFVTQEGKISKKGADSKEGPYIEIGEDEERKRIYQSQLAEVEENILAQVPKTNFDT